MGRVKINPQELYVYLRKNLNLCVTDNGLIYLHNNGRWGKISSREFKAIIKAHLPVISRTKSQIEAVYYEIVETDYFGISEDDFDSDEKIINFSNGIYNIHSEELLPHEPKYLSTIQIPCDFVAGLTWDNAPNFSKFVQDMFGDDYATRDFFLQFCGAVISNIKGSRYKKMLMMVGDGNTGKSLALKLVMELIGRENCVSMDFKKMGERFGTAPLYGKRLNKCCHAMLHFMSKPL